MSSNEDGRRIRIPSSGPVLKSLPDLESQERLQDPLMAFDLTEDDMRRIARILGTDLYQTDRVTQIKTQNALIDLTDRSRIRIRDGSQEISIIDSAVVVEGEKVSLVPARYANREGQLFIRSYTFTHDTIDIKSRKIPSSPRIAAASDLATSYNEGRPVGGLGV